MRKRKAALVLCAAAALSLAACSSQETGEQTSSSQTQTGGAAGTDGTDTAGSGSTSVSGGSILIAYFSVPETDGVDTEASASRVSADGEVMGNNEYIARLIQQETGGDLFVIETVQEYPDTHDDLLDFAYNEMLDDERPDLASQIQDPGSYDVIFLGYPKIQYGF